LGALYGISWDLCHFIEKDAKKEEEDKDIESILKFWTDIHGTGSFFIGLDGSENPPIYEYGIEYVNEDDYEWLIRVSDHFSDLIIRCFFDAIAFRHEIKCNTIEPFTQIQLDSLIQLFPNFNFIKRDLANFENFRSSSGIDKATHSFLMYSDSQVFSVDKMKSQDSFTYTWKLSAKNEDSITDLINNILRICPKLASCLKKKKNL